MDGCGDADLGDYDQGLYRSFIEDETRNLSTLQTRPNDHSTSVTGPAALRSFANNFESKPTEECNTEKLCTDDLSSVTSHATEENISKIFGLLPEISSYPNEPYSMLKNAGIAQSNKKCDLGDFQSYFNQRWSSNVKLDQLKLNGDYIQPTPACVNHSNIWASDYLAHVKEEWHNQQYSQKSNGEEQLKIAVASQPTDEFYSSADTKQILPQQASPGAERVPDNMACSIFTSLFCCLFFGIAAIVLSNQANSMKHTDPVTALKKARSARTFILIGISIGALSAILSIYFHLFTVHQQ